MIDEVIARWHQYMHGEPGVLGRIVEFRVMVRPLQALNTVHRMMGMALENHASTSGVPYPPK